MKGKQQWCTETRSLPLWLGRSSQGQSLSPQGAPWWERKSRITSLLFFLLSWQKWKRTQDILPAENSASKCLCLQQRREAVRRWPWGFSNRPFWRTRLECADGEGLKHRIVESVSGGMVWAFQAVLRKGASLPDETVQQVHSAPAPPPSWSPFLPHHHSPKCFLAP